MSSQLSMSGRRRRGFRRRLLSSLLAVIVCLWAGAFLQFVNRLPTATSKEVMPADGIVVLTGGAERLNVALGLLLDGHAQRLLISGVNPKIAEEDLARTTIGNPEVFACCVDIGREARNTRGNADEAAAWAEANGYRRLIIVTANYHMPRSLLECRLAMPGIELRPYPVHPAEVHIEAWWQWPGTARLLAGEFTKYLLVLLTQGNGHDRKARPA